MAIYTTELLTDRDYNIPEGRLPLEYAVDQSNKAKTHSENTEVHVTAEEKAVLNLFTSSGGRNLVIAADGTVATQIGHSYVVTAKTTKVSVTDTTSGDPLATVPAGTQLGFMATSASATLSSTDCTVTEVFRGAALVELSGSGYPEPPYVAFNAAKTDVTALDITGLTNGNYMFVYCTSLISFSRDLSSLTDGNYMFAGCTSLQSFSSDLPLLTDGDYMFSQCSSLTSFSSALPALSSGSNMFASCSALQSFSSDLPVMTYGIYMFSRCVALTSFSSDLPALSNANYMFYDCSSLTSFSGDLSALPKAENMFDGCTSLQSFSSDLPLLSKAGRMFEGCSSLTSFSSDLPLLTNGSNMFNKCKLDKASALRVLNTIPAYTSGTHNLTLGMASALNSDADITAALTVASAKGWTVTAQYN